MRPEAEKLLFDARQAARSVLEFGHGVSLDDYRVDKLRRSAIERQLFIVGEAIAQLAVVDRSVFDGLTDARRVVGFRNVLAHGYAEVDDERVWDIVRHDLPALLGEVETLLPDTA